MTDQASVAALEMYKLSMGMMVFYLSPAFGLKESQSQRGGD